MSENVGSVSGYFRDMACSLHYLRSHETFTDVIFMCSDGPVHCHKGMLLPHSSLLKSLFAISASRQASDTTIISLPQVEKLIMIKLLRYVYQGQASFRRDLDLAKLYELADVLNFDMSFAKKDSDEEENDGHYCQAAAYKVKKNKSVGTKKRNNEKKRKGKEVRKFKAEAKEVSDNQTREEAPPIVSGKRKRISQAMDNKKEKKSDAIGYTNDSDDIVALSNGMDVEEVSESEINDDVIQNILNYVESDREGLDLDVEEVGKKKASLDKMKIGIKNCAVEEHIKEKVKEIINGEMGIDQIMEAEVNNSQQEDICKDRNASNEDINKMKVEIQNCAREDHTKEKVKAIINEEQKETDSDLEEIDRYGDAPNNNAVEIDEDFDEEAILEEMEDAFEKAWPTKRRKDISFKFFKLSK